MTVNMSFIQTAQDIIDDVMPRDPIDQMPWVGAVTIAQLVHEEMKSLKAVAAAAHSINEDLSPGEGASYNVALKAITAALDSVIELPS